jgi:hypothetical protein
VRDDGVTRRHPTFDLSRDMGASLTMIERHYGRAADDGDARLVAHGDNGA